LNCDWSVRKPESFWPKKEFCLQSWLNTKKALIFMVITNTCFTN